MAPFTFSLSVYTVRLGQFSLLQMNQCFQVFFVSRLKVAKEESPASTRFCIGALTAGCVWKCNLASSLNRNFTHILGCGLRVGLGEGWFWMVEDPPPTVWDLWPRGPTSVFSSSLHPLTIPNALFGDQIFPLKTLPHYFVLVIDPHGLWFDRMSFGLWARTFLEGGQQFIRPGDISATV